MLNSVGLGFIFTARDLASSKLQALERRFSSLDERVGLSATHMTNALTQLGTGLGLFTAGAAGLYGVFAAASTAGKFEQAIAGVAAVSQSTAQELVLLRTAAIEAGIATQYSPIEATLGLRELAQAGFDARESIALLRPVLDLAAGSLGELTPESAAGLASQAIKAFGLSTEQASLSVDQMLQSANQFSLRALDLPLALGSASRGAQTLRQSLTETLIALGFVKNVMPSVERASTAVAVAMERMASPRTQKMLQAQGLSVTDSQRRFRPFLDIIMELSAMTETWTDQRRAGFLIKAFGTEALLGLTAIMTQLTHGVKANTGEILRGTAAVAYYRRAFENAGGTAAAFREKLLDTFAGQKQLLRGSIDTFAIVMGEPFAQVLKPLVTGVVTLLNGLIHALQSLPMPMKKAFAAFAVAASVALAFLGAIVAVKGTIGLLSLGLKALGISLGGMVAGMLPVVLVVGVVGLAISGFVAAAKRNIGDIGDFLGSIGQRVSLFFAGMKQLFESGGFSGAVREELGKVENQGLKGFLVRLYQVGYRASQIWVGFKEGFSASLGAFRPVFESFTAALQSIGGAIAAVFTGLGRGASALPSAAFKGFGAVLGEVFGGVLKVLATGATWILQLLSGIADGFRFMLTYIRPAFSAVGEALSFLAEGWTKLTGLTFGLGGAAKGIGGILQVLGTVIGTVLGGALMVVASLFSGFINVLAAVLYYVGDLISNFIALGKGIGEVAARIYLFFTETIPKGIGIAFSWISKIFQGVDSFISRIAQGIRDVVAIIRDVLVRVLRQIPDEFLPASLERLKYSPFTLEMQNPGSPVTPKMSYASPATFKYPEMPAVSESRGRMDELLLLQSNLMTYASGRDREQAGQSPITVNVQVDGETIAKAVHDSERSNATRAFSPLPVY